jgi:hypothetical protein
MSGAEVTGLITRIDESIADSDQRIQNEVAEYVELHPDFVGEQIADHGFAKIPTFAGDYTLTEEQLREIAGVAA